MVETSGNPHDGLDAWQRKGALDYDPVRHRLPMKGESVTQTGSGDVVDAATSMGRSSGPRRAWDLTGRGPFPVKYRQVFGESPSATLNRLA